MTAVTLAVFYLYKQVSRSSPHLRGGDPTRIGILGGGVHWAVLELQITNLLNRLSKALLFLSHIEGESPHTTALFLKHLSHSVPASQALVFWYSSPQPFLAPGIGFVKENVSMDLGRGDGFRRIQAHCIDWVVCY